MEDKTARLNGYKPRSYGDIVAIATLLTLFISCVAWGLKLESELNAVRDKVYGLESKVGNGILPRAEERIKNIDSKLKDISEEIRDHERNHSN